MSNLFMLKLSMPKFLSWKWILVVWATIALISASMLYVTLSSQGSDTSFAAVLIVKLIVWLFWGAVTPLIITLGKKFSIAKNNRLKGILIHLPLSIILTSMNILLYAFIIYVSSDTQTSVLPLFLGLFLSQFEWYFIIYWAIIIVGYAFEYYEKYKDGELASIKLETELVRSQLKALKMQLHPHFLFNTLNNISALVRQGEQKSAISMLAGISELLRIALAQKDEQEIKLETEIDFIKRYLEIEKVRFTNKLDITYDIEKDTLQSYIPGFILQPVIENAINHGLSKKLSARKLEIAISLKDDYLYIHVYNDGPALENDFDIKNSTGIGLSTTVDRLAQVYHEDYKMNIYNHDKGVKVELMIPFRTNMSYET